MRCARNTNWLPHFIVQNKDPLFCVMFGQLDVRQPEDSACVTSLFLFGTFCSCLARSRLWWKPPAISQRMLSRWSSSGSSAASHFCNLQINIYGPACSAGLSGSGPSGKIWGVGPSLQPHTTLLPRVRRGWARWVRGKQRCAQFCHKERKIKMHLCLWNLHHFCI